MKKILVIICLMFLITGCTNVTDMSYEEILQTIANAPSRENVYRTGYKYYLPNGMHVVDSTLYNEVIVDNNFKYYLYVDVVSYYNKVEDDYKVNSKAIYSKRLDFDGKFGYLEINLMENDKYLVEIMYNYAKIEVIVDSKKCNEVLLCAINILKSVEYNDSIIANLLGADILNFYEEEFDIFNTKGSDSNYIKVDDNYQPVEDELPDTDLVK